MSRRVFAALDADDSRVRLLGFGNYVGDEVPTGAVGRLAQIAIRMNRPNPKIVLDSGKVVWGCECWWGDESRWPEFLKGRAVVGEDIENIRNNFTPED